MVSVIVVVEGRGAQRLITAGRVQTGSDKISCSLRRNGLTFRTNTDSTCLRTPSPTANVGKTSDVYPKQPLPSHNLLPGEGLGVSKMPYRLKNIHMTQRLSTKRERINNMIFLNFFVLETSYTECF